MNAAVRRAERRDDAAGQGRARFYCDARREQVFVLLAGKPLKGENGFLSRLRREDEGARQHAVLEVQAAGISLPRHRRRSPSRYTVTSRGFAWRVITWVRPGKPGRRQL